MSAHDLITLRRNSIGPDEVATTTTTPTTRRNTTTGTSAMADEAILPILSPISTIQATTGINAAASTISGTQGGGGATSMKWIAKPRAINCGVIVTNLPTHINVRDILCRVRGGQVVDCIVSKMRHPGLTDEDTVAVLTFDNASSAQRYFEFASDPFFAPMWTFKMRDKENGMLSEKMAQVNYYTNIDNVDNGDIVKAIGRIQIDSARFPQNASRCTIINSCPFKQVQTILKDLNLLPLLNTQSFRNQIEDIWMDNFTKDGHAGDLHIWFANTKAAIAAMNAGQAKQLQPKLQFEADPCSMDVTTLVYPLDEHPGYQWCSSPNVSLLTLHVKGKLQTTLAAWGNSAKVDNPLPLFGAIKTLVEKSRKPGNYDSTNNLTTNFLKRHLEHVSPDMRLVSTVLYEEEESSDSASKVCQTP